MLVTQHQIVIYDRSTVITSRNASPLKNRDTFTSERSRSAGKNTKRFRRRVWRLSLLLSTINRVQFHSRRNLRKRCKSANTRLYRVSMQKKKKTFSKLVLRKFEIISNFYQKHTSNAKCRTQIYRIYLCS